MNFLQLKPPKKRSVNVNPLQLPTIVRKTLSHVAYKELIKCRFVSKLWNEESAKFLQDKIIVSLTDWHSIEQFNRISNAHIKSSELNLFNAIKLGPNISLADKNVQTALSKLAPNIKELVLKGKVAPAEWRMILTEQFVNLKSLSIHGPAPLQPILTRESFSDGKCSPLPSTSAGIGKSSNKNPELVNLTKLKLNLTNKKTEDIFVRRFLRDLFSLVPNLEYLEMIKEDPFGNDFQKTMFDCLMLKMRPDSLGRLETFKCPSLVCGSKELKDILNRSFPLKEIEIQISSDVSAHYLEHFLEYHGSSLQAMHLGFCPGTTLNVMVSAPTTSLIHLTEISLIEYRRSIGFIGHLPNIKKLTLNRTNIKKALLSIGWSFEHKEQTELSPSLEELYIYNDYLSRDQGNCTREIVLKLAHCFPNLKNIRLEGLDDSSMRHLFKSFNLLEELSAPIGTYTDEAFRSYTDKDQLVASSGKSPNRYMLSAFDASHLKHLRTLVLESIGLTDKFITHGIIHWPSLRNLTIKYCTIGHPTLARTLMEMDLHHLRLQYCTVLTDRVLGVVDDPVEMMRDEDMLDLSYDLIQKWRFGTFKMLFIQTP